MLRKLTFALFFLSSMICSITQAEVNVRLRREKLSITGDGSVNDIRVVVSDAVYVWANDEEDPTVDYPLDEVGIIIIRTKGERDYVDLSYADPPEPLSAFHFADIELDVNTGGGDDEVNVSGLWGETKIVTGSGNDSVTTGAATFCGDCTIKTGGGNDVVTLGFSFAPPPGIAGEEMATTYFEENLTIAMGGGNDYLTMANVLFNFPDETASAPFDTARIALNGNGGNDCLDLSDQTDFLEDTAKSFEECR